MPRGRQDNGAAAVTPAEGVRKTVGETAGYELVGLGMGLVENRPRLAALVSAVLGWQQRHCPRLLHFELHLARAALRVLRAFRSGLHWIFRRVPGLRWLSHSTELDKLKRRNRALAERLVLLGEQLNTYSINNPVNVYVNFARNALERVNDLRADVYIGHGVQSLPAAAALARQTGGRYFCDVIEIPSFFDRAVPVRWHVTNTMLLDNAFETFLRRADGALTIGWALRDAIGHITERVTVIPNYRYREELRPSNRLREQCGLGPGDELVLSLSTVATGFEPVIDALALLPPSVHLASIGRFAPAAYRDECVARAERLGVADRFHYFDPVPYDELTSTVSAADVGLIVRDPAILNNGISLPNRIFDYMFSSVPVCSPEIPDIVSFIRREDMGAVVRDLTPASWAEAIRTVLANKEQLRANALAASKQYVWESLEDELFEVLGRPARVCYLGANQLQENNRTRRMAASLIARGAKVTVCYLQRRQNATEVADFVEDGIHFVGLPR